MRRIILNTIIIWNKSLVMPCFIKLEIYLWHFKVRRKHLYVIFQFDVIVLSDHNVWIIQVIISDYFTSSYSFNLWEMLLFSLIWDVFAGLPTKPAGHPSGQKAHQGHSRVWFWNQECAFQDGWCRRSALWEASLVWMLWFSYFNPLPRLILWIWSGEHGPHSDDIDYDTKLLDLIETAPNLFTILYYFTLCLLIASKQHCNKHSVRLDSMAKILLGYNLTYCLI